MTLVIICNHVINSCYTILIYKRFSCSESKISVFKVNISMLIILSGAILPGWCRDNYSTSDTVPCTRTLKNYTAYKKSGRKWYSNPFYTSDKGYKMQLYVNANGEGSGKGTHLSLFVYVMPGEYDDSLEWPLDHIVTIQLLNWSSDSGHVEKTVNYHTTTDTKRARIVGEIRGGGLGLGKFVLHSDIESNSNSKKYLNENQLCFRIIKVVKAA